MMMMMMMKRNVYEITKELNASWELGTDDRDMNNSVTTVEQQ